MYNINLVILSFKKRMGASWWDGHSSGTSHKEGGYRSGICRVGTTRQ